MLLTRRTHPDWDQGHWRTVLRLWILREVSARCDPRRRLAQCRGLSSDAQRGMWLQPQGTDSTGATPLHLRLCLLPCSCWRTQCLEISIDSSQGCFCPFLFTIGSLYVGKLVMNFVCGGSGLRTSFSFVSDDQIICCVYSASWSLWIRLTPKFTMAAYLSHPLIVSLHLKSSNPLLHFVTVFPRWYMGCALQQILIWYYLLHSTTWRLCETKAA